MARRRKRRSPEEIEELQRKEAMRREQHTEERHKYLELTKRLAFLGTTEEVTMHCPVCGQEVKGRASVRREHWSWKRTTLEFSMKFVMHECPQSAMQPEEAYALMRDCGLTIKQLQGHMRLSPDEIEGIEQSASL